MPQPTTPIKVLIMDDDYLARMMSVFLLTRHLGTIVAGETASPQELLALIGKWKETDSIPGAVMIDAEYQPPEPQPGELVSSIKHKWPGTRVICLSQYVNRDIVKSAIGAGADGILIKNEIGPALAPAILRSQQGMLVVTQSIEPVVLGCYPHLYRRINCISSWLPNPELTPRIYRSFIYKALFSLRAELVGPELNLAKGSVDKYVGYAYQILQSDWSDESYLSGLELSALSPEDRAFHFFSLPPRRQYAMRRGNIDM
jgi:DNA-binding NarL/FixJ family response regulator